MNRRKFERHLLQHACRFDNHGGKHDDWHDATGKRHSVVPRHKEIKFPLARDICKELGIPPPPEK